MKISYYSDTDSLYIELAESPATESTEVSGGVVLDFDVSGDLVGALLVLLAGMVIIACDLTK